QHDDRAGIKLITNAQQHLLIQQSIEYIIEHERLSISHLRAMLKERLPEYMIPATFVLVDWLPLTPNGKIDRRALPGPEENKPQLGNQFVEPITPIEKELAKIWRALLPIAEIGIHDDFFELGGHSLLLTQLASRINQAFKVEMPLRIL